MGYFIGIPEQSLDLVGNSTSFEGYIEADLIATATPSQAVLSGHMMYLQPECVATAPSSEASLATDDIYIRQLFAVAAASQASLAITYPSNEILYYDPAFEV